ncbi:DUF5011 domain-containing protein [Mycoplasmatota bacterium]|nr:DUF5011 domain-containing protein [Mycoplasmatota bacterium]
MKKLFSMMLILLVFGLTLAGCNKPKSTTTTGTETETSTEIETDTIKPLLKVTPTDVTIMFGENYELMTGVEATDNKDGDITGSVTVEEGDFNNEVPGQYVITYRVADSSGNEETATRNLTVLEKMPAVVVDGNKYGMVYNPLLNPKFLMGNSFDKNGNEVTNPWHFDLTKVSVFSKDYFDWLYANYPNRLYAGWTNIAVTDADGKIVLLRDHNCNQYSEENGIEVCSIWSNGTQDNEYKNLHAGFANLTVPDGGHVMVFINDGSNQEGSPRAFGDALMAGGAGLGKEIEIQFPEVIVDHASNQLPIITVPEDDFVKELIVNDTFDVMEGVTVTDNEDGNDVTLETKILKFDDTEYVEVSEVTTTEPSIYIIEYSADYDGFRKVTARRQVVVNSEVAPEEKFLTLGDSQIAVVENPINWTVDGVHLYTKEYWDANVADWATNSYQWAVVAVTDQYGRIVEVRSAWGAPFGHYTVDNPNGAAPDESVWGSIDGTTWAVDMITNLTVPDGGFVIGFGHAAGTNEYRTWAYKNLLTDQEFDGTNDSSDPQQYANLSPIGKVFGGEWFPNVITVGQEDILVVENPADWATYYNVHNGHLYTKAFWDAIDQSQLVDIGDGCMYQWSLVVVLDASGKVVEIRDGATAFEYTEANPSGIAATSWTGQTPTAGLNVPENGYVLAYYLDKEVGYKAFVHTSGAPAEGVTDVNAIGTIVEGKWFTEEVEEVEQDFITVGDEDILVVVDPADWASYHTVQGSHLYTKAFWDAIDQSQLNGIEDGCLYQWSLLVILDEFGRVVEIRDGLTGTEFTATNPAGVAATTWTAQTPTADLVVPENGYVLAFTKIGEDTTWRTAGYTAFVHSSGDHKTAPGTTDVNALGTFVEGKWFAEYVEQDYITVGNEDILVVADPADWASYHTVQGSHLYTKAFWDAVDQSKLNGINDGCFYQWSLLVILDEFGKVVEIRDGLTGTEFTATNPAGVAATTWTAQTPTADLVVPENGYVLAFTKIGEDTTWRTAGYTAFVHSSGDHKTAPGTTDVNALGTFVEGKWFAEIVLPHITVGTEDILVVENPVDWASYHTVQGSHLYTKAYWDAVDQSQLNGINYGSFYQYSLLVVLDETGKVVEIRDGLAGDGFEFTETNPTGVAATTWTRTTPTAGLIVPDNGYVLAFTAINNTDKTWRTAGYKAFVHTSGDHAVGLGTTDVNAIGTTVVLPN